MAVAPAPRRSAMVTRSRSGRATVRDLRRSARILSCAATLKTKKPATASVTDGIRKRKKPVSAAAGILRRKKPASAASEGAEILEAAGKLLEPSELLKLKKEAFEAKDLWEERGVPGALERWIQAKAEEAKEEEARPKKRTKLVKTRLPDALIDVMKTQPYLIEPIPTEVLATKSEAYCRMYHMRKFIDDKMYAYEQALITQHNILGYAEDVTEVTDDEHEELRVLA